MRGIHYIGWGRRGLRPCREAQNVNVEYEVKWPKFEETKAEEREQREQEEKESKNARKPH